MRRHRHISEIQLMVERKQQRQEQPPPQPKQERKGERGMGRGIEICIAAGFGTAAAAAAINSAAANSTAGTATRGGYKCGAGRQAEHFAGAPGGDPLDAVTRSARVKRETERGRGGEKEGSDETPSLPPPPPPQRPPQEHQQEGRNEQQQQQQQQQQESGQQHRRCWGSAWALDNDGCLGGALVPLFGLFWFRGVCFACLIDCLQIHRSKFLLR